MMVPRSNDGVPFGDNAPLPPLDDDRLPLTGVPFRLLELLPMPLISPIAVLAETIDASKPRRPIST